MLLIFALSGCMTQDYGPEEDFNFSGRGLFIVNEGNFQYGNATLSFYSPSSGQVENEVFYRANRMRLGDVAESMTVFGNRGWIVVNNSHVIFAVDLTTFREVGRVEGLTSPRYIHFVSDNKAYVSQLWDNRIFIVNPRNFSITGTIEVPGMSAESGSTEQMVSWGNSVFCCCWSYQDCIIRINSLTDKVDASLTVGLQPNSMVLDRNDKLWVITDGGYDGSPTGFETPALFKIDAETFTVEKRLEFEPGSSPRGLCLSGDGESIFWLNDDVWKMSVNSLSLPSQPLIPALGTRYYGLTVDPDGGDIYVADAIDYQQPGMVYRYSPSGELITRFYAGVNPSAFCWK